MCVLMVGFKIIFNKIKPNTRIMVTTGLCAIILAIICAAYIVVWGLKKK